MEIAWSIGLIVVSSIIGFIAGTGYAYRELAREANSIILTGKGVNERKKKK